MSVNVAEVGSGNVHTSAANARCRDPQKHLVTDELVRLLGGGLLGDTIFGALEHGKGRHDDTAVVLNEERT
jgi:hypothetical protein